MSGSRRYNTTYRKQLRKKINSLDAVVFTRGDLSRDKSNREQLRLNRALKVFVEEGSIIKIGHGLYAKAKKIKLPSGETVILLQESFEYVATQALDRLGIKWELGSAIQEYNRGETTQIPVIFTVKLYNRFRGKIGAQGRKLFFEDNINAR